MPQAEVNIGLVGHVDHGKTTLTKALSGVWTDRHSEEIRRGISIRLGYADCSIYFCEKCSGYKAFSTKKKCPHCGSPTKFLRKVSFVDAPGHETLIATMLSGSALMDGVILVIAADEPCPQPQTKEHLLALQIMGIKNIIVVQNKVDVVSKEEAKKNKEQIEQFLKKYNLNPPIIPIAANYNANTDVLIAAIQEFIPTPKRDETKPAKMFVARSFDINKPGTPVSKILGGVLGGSLLQGELRVGDKIEIKPGVKRQRQNQDFWETITTRIVSIDAGEEKVEVAKPGGLIAIQTQLDPYLTKSDSLSGNVVGKPGTLPNPMKTIECTIHILEREVLNTEVQLTINEPLMVSIGTTVTVGVITRKKGNTATMSLKTPIVAEKGERIAISKRINMKWRLIGYAGIL